MTLSENPPYFLVHNVMVVAINMITDSPSW
ncbi:hypothetical protein E1A91_A13G270900v1 [Gossypium mustelinum]|uniref:Uncharacterized protein n=1 Tax=Gossypium mustelinum TaxID=34275 RepID=A0A5D2WN95_GOSMU|nr:hypothetical protein E1A91_A13G270900v1 [Gossypium mustelinum]